MNISQTLKNALKEKYRILLYKEGENTSPHPQGPEQLQRKNKSLRYDRIKFVCTSHHVVQECSKYFF